MVEHLEKSTMKKLYLSNKNRKIAGFCGGLAEYLDVDPTVVRLVYLFLTLLSMGAGILVYIVAWIIVPKNPK